MTALTLTEFVLARIGEDEAVAQGASRTSGGATWLSAQIAHRTGGIMDAREDDHIARHDPVRVLAECEAKRAIVELHDDQHDDGDPRSWEYPYVGCATLRALASVYASHPDYRAEWATS